MLVPVIGFSRVDFVNDQKEHIAGTTVYYTSKDPRVEGMKAEKAFIPQTLSSLEGLKPNDTINIDYNQKGKVIGVSMPQQTASRQTPTRVQAPVTLND
jgi:uncharacterized protein YuzE